MTAAATSTPPLRTVEAVAAAERIRAAFERTERALRIAREAGRGTAVTKVRVTEGLTCEINDGAWSLVADFKEKAGGAGRGPDPGVLGRSALGSCIAIGYVLWAARLGVPITSVAVEVQADYDARGMYGAGDVSPVYSEVRYIVFIESDAPQADVMRVLDTADRHSSYLNIFRGAVKVKREVRLTSPGRE